MIIEKNLITKQDSFNKYLKYKKKYLDLKNLKGTGFDFNKEEEKQFLTNNLEISDLNPYYFKQNLFSYWISSSHNTYLPFGQMFDPSSVCYYKLQSLMYHGGCMEIDTFAVTKDYSDVIITHLHTNSKTITLTSIFKIINIAIENKIKNNIISGPIISTFDNKNLKTEAEHMVFWNILDKVLLIDANKHFIYKIEKDYDISIIPIDVMNNKILLRWGENKTCKIDETYEINKLDKQDIGKEVCKPPEYILKKFSSINSWMHLKKGHVDLNDEIYLKRNETVSVMVGIEILPNYKSKQNLISNTQRNIMRIYPLPTSVTSSNYNNMKYFKDGVQIVAINIQKVENPLLLNKAVFLPNTGLPCTPEEILSTCPNGWKNSVPVKSKQEPLAYRLKPLWLLGLIPHPGYYNLQIELKKVEKIIDNKLIDATSEYPNFKLLYGLNDSTKLDNIDISIPFFIAEVSKLGSTYISGIEIPWNFSKLLNNEIQVDLYKIKTKGLNYNDVKLDEGNPDNDCDDSYLLNIEKQIRITLSYNWTKSKEVESLKNYNEKIIILRDEYNQPTINFLNKLTLFNEYQDKLAVLLNT